MVLPLGKIRPKNAINIYDTRFYKFQTKAKIPMYEKSNYHITPYPSTPPHPYPHPSHPLPSTLSINEQKIGRKFSVLVFFVVVRAWE